MDGGCAHAREREREREGASEQEQCSREGRVSHEGALKEEDQTPARLGGRRGSSPSLKHAQRERQRQHSEVFKTPVNILGGGLVPVCMEAEALEL